MNSNDFEAAQAALVGGATRRPRDRRVSARLAAGRSRRGLSPAGGGHRRARRRRRLEDRCDHARAASHPGRAATDRRGHPAGDDARRQPSTGVASLRRLHRPEDRVRDRFPAAPRSAAAPERAVLAPRGRRRDRGDAPGDRDRRSALAGRQRHPGRARRRLQQRRPDQRAALRGLAGHRLRRGRHRPERRRARPAGARAGARQRPRDPRGRPVRHGRDARQRPAAKASPGLRAGDIVTTGSCTGAPLVPGPGLYRAEFSDLGAVELRFE